MVSESIAIKGFHDLRGGAVADKRSLRGGAVADKRSLRGGAVADKRGCRCRQKRVTMKKGGVPLQTKTPH